MGTNDFLDYMWLLTQNSRRGGDGEGVGECNTLIITERCGCENGNAQVNYIANYAN